MRIKNSTSGFSLLELIVVLVILGFLVAMMAKVFTHGDDQKWFDETRTKMEEIKKALLGTSGAYANGQRQFAGYITDMGGLVPLIASSVDGNGTGHQYRCVRGHTAIANNRPETGANWANYWVLDNNQPGGSWIEGAEYINIASSSVDGDGAGTGQEYICIKAHTSTADTRPESGVYWDSYWIRCDGEVGGAWAGGTEYISGESILWDAPYYVDGVGAGVGHQYRCIRAHTAEDSSNPGSVSNQPESGANWATYWMRDDSQPVDNPWIVDAVYVSPWRYRTDSVDGDGAGAGHQYRCINAHTAAAANRPESAGPGNWEPYWVRDNAQPGGVWGVGNVYIDSKIWVGWRGPYIETPPRDILADAWGNAFVFIPGPDPRPPILTPLIPPAIQAWDIKIVSYGADNAPGGTEFNEDIVLVIRRIEYMAPVAGRVNWSDPPIDSSEVKVIGYFALNGSENRSVIDRVDNTSGYFRFEEGTSGNGLNGLNMPLGLRSVVVWEDDNSNNLPDIGERSESRVFTVEPTGNWLGDIEIQ